MTWVWVLIAVFVFVLAILVVLCLAINYTRKDEPYIQEIKEYIQNFKFESIKLDNVDVEKANKLIEKVVSKIKDKEAVKVTTLGLETLEGKLWRVNTIKNFSEVSIETEQYISASLYNLSFGSSWVDGSSSSFINGAITENKPDTELDFNLLKDILGEQPKQLLFKKDWSLVDISYINEEANQKLEELKIKYLNVFRTRSIYNAVIYKNKLDYYYAPTCITKHETCYYHKPTHLLIKINYEI